jgi:endo-alpha-1,4-polygalactosaminidase (GH114 family)
MQVNWLRSFVVRAYFGEIVNDGVDGVCLEALHAFWLWQARRKKVEGSIDEEARDAKA